MLASPKARMGGYGSPLAKSSREVEYELFARVTRALQAANASDDRGDRIHAIVDNTHLWTELAADLADPGNGLPEDLKGKLINLAVFSIRQGHRAVAGEGEIVTLIDINLNIMKGLRGKGAI